MRHRLIPVALATGASLALLAGTAMAATPTWTVVPGVNPSATTLNAVSARTATDAWAVGQFQGAGDDAGSQIFAERWNGTQWQQLPTPNIVRQDERLLGVSASGPNDAWAVGNTNVISFASHDTLAAHWDGTAWTIVPTPDAASHGRLASLYDVADLSPANAWAVGQGKDARPLAEHWDGTAWSVVKTANTAEPTGLSGVTAISANNAWAVGNGFNNVHDTSASVANKAVIEHWNGTAWSIVASPAGLISVDRISAASATDVWASGQAPLQTIGGVPVPVARTLHWNGTAWSAMPGPTGSDPNTEVTGLSALPSGEAWAAGATFSATAATAFIAHHTP